MYTLKEFMALDPKSLVLPKPDCSICKKPISGVHSDDFRMIPAGPVHDDCYFHELGNLVETHPLLGSRHGGHGPTELSVQLSDEEESALDILLDLHPIRSPGRRGPPGPMSRS